MNNKGFIISIPQIIIGGLSMFVAILSIRIIMPILNPILNLTWSSSLTKGLTTLAIYLVIAFIFYIIVYGTVMGKTPNILNKKREEY